MVRAPHRNNAVKSNRPVNLSLSTVLAVNLKSPVAVASILHRVSGVVIFLLIPVLLYMLQQSLESPQAFDILRKDVLGGLIGGGLAFIALAGLIFHFVVGAKHLIQDFGVGESLNGGRLFATGALVLAGLLILCAFVWVML
ncbi:MAG: succinate dehydrogenase, cytochrome b556 subunit [Moraxellaceae bacterium]|jgi:succinate dehydrogenase / fumarate reductase cytochrome b subunit|nr:succinate dehydrogenase, cytochrome b556 subunit [Moraxellaceae bacterium]